ncbi:MAG: glycosyltransferase family 2 protein [Gemmatimonadaceae bacterium]|nr:glycosyltransferase family 2 protein [Gemmatimonadaceae bacterium]
MTDAMREGILRNRPLASVVVNNHNYGRFLRDAIDSALAQTYTPLEVIVVDDGSTDDSRDVIASYGDRVLPVLKENGGQGSAFNAGFAASRGEVIVFLDADDVLLTTAVGRALELIAEPGVVKIHWPLWDIDASGRRTGGTQPAGALSEGDMRDTIILRGPLGANSSPTSGNAWSRRFLERVLPMPEREFAINSDAYLVTLAWIYGLVRIVAEPQALYRIHGENNFVSKPLGEKRQRQYEMYTRRCDALARHLLSMEVDFERWMLNGPFRWHERQVAAKLQIANIIPQGTRFILVDEDGWDEAGNREVVAGRYAVPFLERDGQYWGRPADDQMAIQDLDRLRAAGAAFIVFTWYCIWWLDEFPGLNRYLRTRYRCVLSTDLLVAFDLR